MDFARLWEQAKELWARPVGKLLLGGVAVFLVVAASLSFLWSRPTYVTLGTFDAADAPKVAQKLNEAKIPFDQSGTGYTFKVQKGDEFRSKLALAEINLDPAGTIWSTEPWKGNSWSNTEFDKRQIWVQQTETNLTKAIKSMSVVENARVQISVPMNDKPLFKDQEKPPKAMVVVQPRKGQELSIRAVEAIMETVAAAVEGLDKTAVVVMDAYRSRVVSGDAFKKQDDAQAVGQAATDQLTVVARYQDHWQKLLTEQLEKVVGPGNASVIVSPMINWDRAVVEALDYKGAGANGKGVPVSEQNTKSTSDGTAAPNPQNPAGTTPNADTSIPGYPGTTGKGNGTFSSDQVNNIVNYLVNQTKTTTEKPGGAIDEISVGIFVNGGGGTIAPAQEQSMKNVVAMAMGSKARVELAAMPFAPGLLDDFKPTSPVATGTPNWLYLLLAVALTLGGIGFFFVAIKPRRPILEPVFAGPEGAMMGGIPVSDLELAAAADAYSAQSGIGGDRMRSGEPGADVAELAPEEIALLGDEFLEQLGVDPAKVRMKEKVEKIAKVNPEAVASLLKTWISEQ